MKKGFRKHSEMEENQKGKIGLERGKAKLGGK